MKAKIFFLGLIALMLGGCGYIRNITETTYFNPSWLPNGRIICTKYVGVDEFNSIAGTYNSKSKNYYITTMNADGSDERDEKQIDAATVGGDIAASPDGKYAAITSGASIKVYNSDFTDYSTITPSDGKIINYLDFSPTSEGYKIVYTNSTKEMRLTDINASFNNLLTTSAEVVAWRVGEKIVYDGNWINSIKSDGTNNRMIIEKSWLPQKATLDKVVYQGNGLNIYSINLDGSSNQFLLSSYNKATLKLSFTNDKIVGGDLLNNCLQHIYVTDISCGKTMKLR